MMKLLIFCIIALQSTIFTRLTETEALAIPSLFNATADDPVTSNDSPQICTSTVCRQAAKDILKRMDESLDPCNDFYEFSCGNFLKYGSIDDEYSTFYTRKVKEGLKDIIRLDERSYNLESLRKMRSFNQQCLDRGYSDTLQYFETVFKKLKGWPVLEKNWSEENFDWFRYFKILKKENLSVPYPVDVEEGFWAEIIFLKDLDKRKINDSQRLQQMIDLVVSFGANEEVARKDMTDCFTYENKLIEALLDEPSTWTAYEDFNTTKPWFSWDELLEATVKDLEMIEQGHVFTNLPVRLIPRLRKMWEETSKRTQANYMILRSIESSLRDISAEYLARMRNELSSELWCTSNNNNNHELFFFPLVSEYLKRNYDQNHIASRGIVENLKMQYLKELKKLPSHYPETILSDVETLYQNLSIILGYPKILLNETLIDAIYADFQPKLDNYFKLARKLKSIGQKPLGELEMHDILDLFNDNAYFRGSGMNIFEIVLTIPKMGPPYYSKDYPAFVNYGRLGTTFGHELAHTFTLVPLSELDRTNQNRKCIENQYSGSGVDSTMTNEEDLADNAGFRLAYNAYLDYLMQRNWTDLELPNLNYTPQQMFWISKATSFCEISPFEFVDEHSPHRIRINNAFANIKEFREDFQCSKNSLMFPKTECTGFR